MEKRIIQLARILSALCFPFYMPTWAFLWLLFFSYLRLLPLGYKLLILGIVVTFTVLIPVISINASDDSTAGATGNSHTANTDTCPMCSRCSVMAPASCCSCR